VNATATHKIDTSLNRSAPAPVDPLAGAQNAPASAAPVSGPVAPAVKPAAPADPLSGAAKQ